MNIEQTKCDHCGKLHEQGRNDIGSKLVHLRVPINFKLDFCSDDCLFEYFLKSRRARLAAALLKSPAQTSQAPEDFLMKHLECVMFQKLEGERWELTLQDAHKNVLFHSCFANLDGALGEFDNWRKAGLIV